MRVLIAFLRVRAGLTKVTFPSQLQMNSGHPASWSERTVNQASSDMPHPYLWKSKVWSTWKTPLLIKCSVNKSRELASKLFSVNGVEIWLGGKVFDCVVNFLTRVPQCGRKSPNIPVHGKGCAQQLNTLLNLLKQVPLRAEGGAVASQEIYSKDSHYSKGRTPSILHLGLSPSECIYSGGLTLWFNSWNLTRQYCGPQ